MNILLWRLAATYHFMVMAHLNLKFSWDLAGNLQEESEWEDYSPKEAVLSELSYWDF